MKTNTIWLDEVDSTSNYLARNLAADTPQWTVVAAHCQTAGRGQRGNSWEAEQGKNLTFSLLLHPRGIEACEQFRISQAVSLGIVDTLRPLLPGREVKIKWPNDIYVGNSKICGILIENSLSGKTISHSIAGIGINVNQRRFLSNAPNPVSMIQLLGHETALEPLLNSVVEKIAQCLAEPEAELKERYFANLWSRECMTYRDVATGSKFNAAITAIGPLGHITLTRADGNSTIYAFKEVAVVLPV
ncbi:MAG: biotin--[acetyl-CoA-carboxylase] ligase [Muribaculum sp.]|nr:biotin--[acetyl-CoA-carboxylase] ligase [Muribaculaceae bacterium]MCM1080261.1 biotin--[acetyl-CoA-carboxylase] ligase [Muribaculum sp.]